MRLITIYNLRGRIGLLMVSSVYAAIKRYNKYVGNLKS